MKRHRIAKNLKALRLISGGGITTGISESIRG